MGLGGDNISTWEHMNKTFLDKYQDYYNDKDQKESIFKMTQQDESLQDYEQI